MTKFTQRRFSVSAPINDAYAENWERTFRKEPRDEQRIASEAQSEYAALTGIEEPRSNHASSKPIQARADGPRTQQSADTSEVDNRIAMGMMAAPRTMSQDEAAMRRAVAPKIEISRAEIEKWVAKLEFGLRPTAQHRVNDINFVLESMKLVLQADRLTDPQARKK